jgi:DNA-binding transcriptional LysR family regulator
MELHQFRCAVALADEESFTRAATSLHMTQPALSYVVAKLERELGTRLFERLPRRVVTTPAGRAFVERARAALVSAEAARDAVAMVNGLLVGELGVGCVPNAVFHLAATIAEFRRLHAGVEVQLLDPAEDRDVAQQVRSGRCELGVVRASLAPPDLVQRAWADLVVVAAFPAAMEASLAPGAVPLEQVSRSPNIAPLRGTHSRMRYDDLFRAAGLTPSIALECDAQELRLELVRQGVGVAFTTVDAPSDAGGGSLVLRRVEPALRSILVVVHRRGELSPAARAFCGIGDGRGGTAAGEPVASASAAVSTA